MRESMVAWSDGLPNMLGALDLNPRLHKTGTPVIVAPGKYRQDDQKVKAILNYIARSRIEHRWMDGWMMDGWMDSQADR